MDFIVTSIQDKLEFPIDLHGQRIAERALWAILSLGGIVALLFAYLLTNLSLTVYVFPLFVSLAGLVTVPSFAKYNEHPLTFLKRPPPKKIDIEL